MKEVIKNRNDRPWFNSKARGYENSDRLYLSENEIESMIDYCDS